MEIGKKIRRLRKLRGLTIEELSQKSNITKGFISQLERDLASPSILTLKQVLDVLGVDLSAFFSDISETEKSIFTVRDRIVESTHQNYKSEILVPKMKYLEMEPILISLEPAAEYDIHFQEDEGFGFIARGTIELRIDDEEKSVGRGDCFYVFFDQKIYAKNLTQKNAEILMVHY